MKFTASAALAASLATTVSAHGGVLSYNLGGKTYKGFTPYNSATSQPATIQREWDTYNPIQDPTQTTMRCNANGAASQLTATVAAGSKVTAYWNSPWPHNIGPTVVWMANCGGSCANFDGSGNVWVCILRSLFFLAFLRGPPSLPSRLPKALRLTPTPSSKSTKRASNPGP